MDAREPLVRGPDQPSHAGSGELRRVMGGRSHLAWGCQVRGLAAEHQPLEIGEPRHALDVGHRLGRGREQAGERGP